MYRHVRVLGDATSDEDFAANVDTIHDVPSHVNLYQATCTEVSVGLHLCTELYVLTDADCNHCDWRKQPRCCDRYKQNTGVVTDTNRTLVLWPIQTEHWYCDWYKQNTGIVTDTNRTLVLWLIQTNTGIVTDTNQHWCCDWYRPTLVLWLIQTSAGIVADTDQNRCCDW